MTLPPTPLSLPIVWDWFLSASSWALAVGWSWQLLAWLRGLPRVANLNRVRLPQLPALPGPHVTVIVPACNEAASIRPTLLSLLASEGIQLQILAVNDRSTDQTGVIMEQVEQSYPQSNLNKKIDHSIQVVAIKHLDEHWLGKPHALAAAAAMASADWLLFTDGDVLFAPEAIRRALQYALAEEADHLVVMPEWTTESHGEAAMHGAMHALSTWTLRLWRIANPKSRDFLGVGAFNLIRRSVYEDLGGFTALRMEVLEDLRLGWMVKRAGYRQRVALAPGLVSVRWANGAWGVVRNLEKNLFALYRYNSALAALASLGLAAQILWPLLAIVHGGWARAAGLLTYAAIVGLYAASRRVTGVRLRYALVFPLAAGLFLFAHIRSVSLALLRGGIDWRGTRYSLRELRAYAGRFW